MRFLFCNDSYPGLFGSLPSNLASDATNQVMFLSFYPRREDISKGIIHARLNVNRTRGQSLRQESVFLSTWERMFHLGKQTLQAFTHIRESGFVPDIVFVSFLDGSAFFLRHAFPDAFIAAYFNGFRVNLDTLEGNQKFQAMMEPQHYLAMQSDLYFVRSEHQKAYFPRRLLSSIHVLPPYVDTEFFTPRPQKLTKFFSYSSDRGELVTIHMKGGMACSKELMKLVVRLLLRRPTCFVALTFGKKNIKSLWENMFSSQSETILSRLFLAEGLDHEAYHSLLCSTTVHLFPEYVSPPLQEMMESMSCGTLLMTPVADGEDSILRDGENMLAFPEAAPEKQLKKICYLLDNINSFDMIRKNARQTIERNHSESEVLSHHLNVIMKGYAKFVEER